MDPGVHAAKRVVSVTAVSLRVGGEGDQFTGRCSVGEYWRAYDGESSEAVDARWPDVALRPGLPARSSACIYGADLAALPERRDGRRSTLEARNGSSTRP